MFYRSFFYECLVNLYFKKKFVLGCFRAYIYSFQTTQTFLVKSATQDDLKNLSTIRIYIRFFNLFRNYLMIQENQLFLVNLLSLTYYYFDKKSTNSGQILLELFRQITQHCARIKR